MTLIAGAVFFFVRYGLAAIPGLALRLPLKKIAAWVARLGLNPSDIPFYETMIAVEGDASRIALRAMSGESVVNGVAAAIVNAILYHLQGAR